MRVCPRCSAIYRAQVLSCATDGSTLVERADDPLIGSQISRFTLEAIHSEGTLGRIYRAKDVAVRILYGDFGSRELVVQRCLKEAEGAKCLQHSNTARILEVGSDDGSVFIAMELAEGVCIDRWIEGEPKEAMDLARVATVLAQIAASLAEAHDADILHRNLSPRNIMVGRTKKRDAVKVLDYGLSSLSRSSLARRLRTSRDYAAPEALEPAGATRASDVYSLGLIAGDLIAPLGNGKTEVGALVAQMVNPDPSKRPQSGRDVLDRLDALGYSPLNLPGRAGAPPPLVGEMAFNITGVPMTKELATDLEADGLVVVRTSETPDVRPAMDGLVVALPGSAAPPATTRYVYSGNEIAVSDTAVEEIDVLESQRKLGFLADQNGSSKPDRKPSNPGVPEETRRSIVLPRKPVVEKTRTSDPAARPLTREGPSVDPTKVALDAKSIIEVQAPAKVDPPPPEARIAEPIETDRSTETERVERSIERIERTVEVDLQSIVEVKPAGSQDLDADATTPLLDPIESFESTDEIPAPILGSGDIADDHQPPRPPDSAELSKILQSADLEQIEDDPFDRPAISLSSAADLVGTKAVGGISTLPVGTRHKPRASWPTADLVLPAKTDLLDNAPVRDAEARVPSRAGAYEGRAETMIIRPRAASRSRAPTAVDITDRASDSFDPAETSISGDLVRPTRSAVVPILVGALIVAVTAGALLAPRMMKDRDVVERPVLIEAKSTPEAEFDLPEGDAPAEDLVEAPKPLPEPAVAEVVPDPEPPIVEEREETPKPEAEPEKAKKAEPEVEPVKAEPEKVEPEKVEPVPEKVEPEPEPEDDPEPRKRPKKKRSRAKTAKSRSAPDKLERGTLIDPFAE